MKCPKEYRKDYARIVREGLAGLLIVAAMVLLIGIAFVI